VDDLSSSIFGTFQLASVDMSAFESPENSNSFKFPFTDGDDAGLKLSDKIQGQQQPRTPPTRGPDDAITSSDFGMGLSPIARDRDSGASTISCSGSISGDIDSVDIINQRIENSKHVSPQSQSGNITTNDGTSDENARSATKDTQSQKMPQSLEYSHPPSAGSFESAIKQVGEHSINFIDKIRDAAHKRKVEVTRSRDSLIAKEQEQLRSIAECKSRFAALTEKLQSRDERHEEAAKENYNNRLNKSEKQFKLSRRSNRDRNGFGGTGVPKVEKRPTTTPLSPKLGIRRKERNVVPKASERTKTTSERGSTIRSTAKSIDRLRFNDTNTDEDTAFGKLNLGGQSIANGKTSLRSESRKGNSSTFKARPIPSSATRRWNAGQVGIPKVSKRAVTIPVSPCLGPKRQSRIIKKCIDKSSKKDVSLGGEMSISSRSMLSPSSVKSSPLLGLTLVDSTRKQRITKIESNQNIFSRTQTIFKPFIPQSTSRAKLRRQYDISRDENQTLNLEEKRKKLRSRIKIIRRELKILSKDLT